MSDFNSDYHGLQNEAKWSRVVIMGCMASIAMLTFAVINKEPVITLVPPNLGESATLHHNMATAGIHKGWSLYVAETLGNVTPSTANFIRETLDPLLAPEIRDQAMVILEQQIDEIKRDRVSFSFEPREVIYDEKTNTTKVVGRHFVHAIAGEHPEKSARTFEFKWVFKDHIPKLAHINTYGK